MLLGFVFLQAFDVNARVLGDLPHANPPIHGMLAYGYYEDPTYGVRWVYYRTSWASGAGVRSQWNANRWQAELPVRGVIGFHPRPKVRSLSRQADSVTLAWDPSPSDSLAGYTVYCGTKSGVYTRRTFFGNVTNATISGLLSSSLRVCCCSFFFEKNSFFIF